MTTKIRVTDLDFDAIKADLKNYLKTKPEFTDYNFEGSNLNVILDILAYNTHYQALMANFLANEMFIDTAAKRSSVVSHAKFLGYTPQSATSAKAVISLTVTPDPSYTSLTYVLPSNTRFLASVENTTYAFVTLKQYTVNRSASNLPFVFTGVEIYEGTFARNTVEYDDVTNRIEIPNASVDLNTMSVRVQLLNSSTFQTFSRMSSFLDVDDTSRAYFIQEGFNENYELYFGDGTVGVKPSNGSTIQLDYVTTNGSVANGARVFVLASNLGTNWSGTATTTTVATGGKDREDLESIRYNAVNYFGSQNRAVVTDDYKMMASLASQNIRSITAWGGEDNTPPDYGSVYLCVIPTAGESLTQAEKTIIKDFIKKKAVGNTRLNFKDPEYIDIVFSTSITFDQNVIDIPVDQLETLVRASITTYSRENLSKFSGKFRLSALSKEIDNTDDSIMSNSSSVVILKQLIPNLFESSDITINLFNPIDQTDSNSTVYSDSFIRTGDNVSVTLEDDRQGNLRLVTFVNGSKRTIDPKAGTVDYVNGVVYVNPINISGYSGSYLGFHIKPRYSDLYSSKNVVLRLNNSNITITSKADR